MGKLLGKRALVTAGAQGIGLGISRMLLGAGCDVFVHYKTSSAGALSLAEEASRLGRRCFYAPADLTDAGQCERIVASAVQFLGGLDILVNNAGSLLTRRPFSEADDGYWADIMSLNVDSLRRVTRAALPHLTASAKANGGASIVNLSSISARLGGSAGAVPYSTAKGAVLTLTRGLARELASAGIRVNAILPGLVLGTRLHEQHTPPEAQRAPLANIPLGRAGTIEDIGRTAVFLASEYDGFITGVGLDVSGGACFS